MEKIKPLLFLLVLAIAACKSPVDIGYPKTSPPGSGWYCFSHPELLFLGQCSRVEEDCQDTKGKRILWYGEFGLEECSPQNEAYTSCVTSFNTRECLAYPTMYECEDSLHEMFERSPSKCHPVK